MALLRTFLVSNSAGTGGNFSDSRHRSAARPVCDHELAYGRHNTLRGNAGEHRGAGAGGGQGRARGRIGGRL